jgi:putative membrane protein insertion efficiency factor
MSVCHHEKRRTLLALPLILLARLWQIGPSRVLPPTCRYDPSCSAYAIQAWSRYGALVGSWLALKRLLRCHPWGGCGADPLP